jgi:hypothetical protein
MAARPRRELPPHYRRFDEAVKYIKFVIQLKNEGGVFSGPGIAIDPGVCITIGSSPRAGPGFNQLYWWKVGVPNGYQPRPGELHGVTPELPVVKKILAERGLLPPGN